ncbi:MAG TPA: preprotein translocase subunit SecE [Micromonosporaceae bacterium]
MDGKPARVGTAVKRAKADPDSDTRSKAKTKPGKGKADKPEASRRVGPVGRLTRFIREVFAELRKVIWPTRKELLTYTVVVVFFVAVMLAIIGLLDVAFARAMLWVFGSNTAEE